MSTDPPFLSIYADVAEDLISSGAVRDIDFARRTYQVEIQVPKEDESYWVFMQFGPKGRLADSFCSCDDYDSSHACLHVATAYAQVKRRTRPMHERFTESFWNNLCRVYYKAFPNESDFIIEAEGYSAGEDSDAHACTFQARNKEEIQRLHDLIDEREPATEENSLKFSNLSPEEYEAWVHGQPSESLSYELSIWADLAKILFLKQELGEEYQLTFRTTASGLPNGVDVLFSGIKLEFSLLHDDLYELIPTLNTIRSSLVLLDHLESQIKMSFNSKKGELYLEAGPQDSKSKSKVIQVGDWCLVPGEGFYRSHDEAILETPVIKASSLGRFLDEHWDLVRSNLEDWPVHTELRPLQYTLKVLPKPEIRVQAFFEKPGDLSKGASRLYGSWAFIEGQGFFRVSGQLFLDADHTVPQQKISGFIAEHRTWLNNHPQFQVHLATVEARMHYVVDEDDSLLFVSRLIIGDDAEEAIDLGDWVYLEGSGFLSKRAAGAGLSFQGGRRVPEHKVAMFIRGHRNELEQIPYFFSKESPVATAGLRIALNSDGNVSVEPHTELRRSYRKKNIRFYGEFVYVEGEGFHSIALDHRIPARFRQPCVIPSEDLPLFLAYELEDLRPFATSVDPHLKYPLYLHLRIDELREVEESSGQFHVKLVYESEIGGASIEELAHGCRQSQHYVVTSAGVIDLEQTRFDWIRQAAGEGRKIEGKRAQISIMELLRLHAFEDLNKAYTGDDEKRRAWLEELTTLQAAEIPSTKGLKSRLRNYQIKGVQWLWFLYQNGLSGLLCDDMGLGKTHQAMALMAAARLEMRRPVGRGNVPPPFLIVCPTSVLYHWQEKLQQFLPKLRTYTFYGVKRSLDDLKRLRYDVILTSYGVLRVDREALRAFSFELAIFDEIQVAKNHLSRVHSALLGVTSKMRLGLTGTPIENRLRELKALFDVVLTGYMPSERHYREFFVTPIERDADPHRKELLSAYIRPFILRRRKIDVLDDLPRKTEEVGHCDLFPEQSQLYDEVLSGKRDAILGKLTEGNAPVPYVHIFAILTHLKQICNHPAVYLKEPENYQQHASGKWNLFKELLSEALASEQKIVVFSQYLGMLDIMQYYLSDLGISFAMVRGDTRDRRQELMRFRDDPDCKVFLGSLLAVGVGVDLTAASVVIHYDRWWNPAKENQATDRVHRIGQQRGVQVFKLVTVGTVEEKIDALIARKGKLAEEILGQDDQNLVKALTREDLVELLQYVSAQENQK